MERSEGGNRDEGINHSVFIGTDMTDVEERVGLVFCQRSMTRWQ